jgi:phage tail sheath protein FI
MIKSDGPSLGFSMDVYDSSEKHVGRAKFNFNRSSPKYIRNVFNTNPTKTNSDVTPSNRLVNYWLGESFERSLRANVTGSTAGHQLGFLVPLQHSGSSVRTGNWSYRFAKHQVAKTGWIFGRDTGEATSFNVKNQLAKPLFRFCSLHGGDDLQKEIMIAIEDIKLPVNTNVDAFSKFTVCVKDMMGNNLEKFTNLTLNQNDPRFIRNVIGDAYPKSWNETSRKYEIVEGSIPNRSRYIRVEFDGAPDFTESDVPWGFAGPERPIGFKLVPSASAARILDPDGEGKEAAETVTDKTFFKGSGSVPLGPEGLDNMGLVAGLGPDQRARFTFPSIPLRKNGTEGGATNPYKVYWGIRPKLSTSSTVHDNDYVDYLRALPAHYNTSQHTKQAADGFEHSFIFTLDDIKIEESTNTVTWVSGSRALGNSYTAMSGAKALTDKKVRQFVMPLWGGRHGFNIKEKEPLSNSLMTTHFSNAGDTEDLARMSPLFSVKKAIATAHDPEVAPANLLVAPGFWFKQVTQNLIDTAEERQDVLAIIDIENDYTTEYENTDDETTRTGTAQTAKDSLDSRVLDSTYACAFYPAVQIMDVLNNNRMLWAPASLAGLGGIAQSEAASAAWFAPAGFNRGGLGALGGSSGPVVTRARQRLDSDDRDLLYDEANVNPIATFPNEGVVIFGQKTLQAASNSALSRINVRRLLIYLKTRINTVAQNILFDQNLPSTWARFVGQAEPILADVKARFGLADYKLVLDETTTTPELIDQNVLYAQVYLKPARAIEYIAIDFIVTRTGASFV